MADSRKMVLKETALLMLGETVAAGLMYVVYALLGYFTVKVLLGGIVGVLVTVANFFFMALVATLAADKAEQQDVAGGQKLMKSAYPVRLLVMALILFACAKSGWFDLIALVLPLLLERPVIMVLEFFRKRGA